MSELLCKFAKRYVTMGNTAEEFDIIAKECKDLFLKKNNDYGTAWRILRIPSLTDQIFIKAQRIRSIQEKGTSKVQEGITSEFIGIINYSIMALIQLNMGVCSHLDPNLNDNELISLFDKHIFNAKDLMIDKNHDYGEAWRSMRISSLTDIILMKLLRVKQIEDHDGKTLISEGLEANYYDIINYAVFALIRIIVEKSL